MKTLAMIKMEKNFVAHIEKHHPRKPYEAYTIGRLIDRLKEELNELLEAYEYLEYEGMKGELADISNIVDYLFETLVRKECMKP